MHAHIDIYIERYMHTYICMVYEAACTCVRHLDGSAIHGRPCCHSVAAGPCFEIEGVGGCPLARPIMASGMEAAETDMFPALFGGDGGDGGLLQSASAGWTLGMAEPVGVAIETGAGAGDGGDGSEGDDDMESGEEGFASEVDASVSASASSRQVMAGPSGAQRRASLAAPKPSSAAERAHAVAISSSGLAANGPSHFADASAPTLKRNSNVLRRRAPSSAADHDGGPMRSDDVGEYADWTSVKMHGMSLSDPFPAGQLLKALQGARNTVHKHILELSKCKWFAKQKPASLKAAAGRWADHEPKMQKDANLDVQVAYKQLVARAKALQNLHCALRRWLASRDVSVVSDIVSPLDVLEPVVHCRPLEEGSVGTRLAYLAYLRPRLLCLQQAWLP